MHGLRRLVQEGKAGVNVFLPGKPLLAEVGHADHGEGGHHIGRQRAVIQHHAAVGLDLPSLHLLRELPEQPYIFVPIQIPDDRVIVDFSDVGMVEVLQAALALAKQEGCRLVVKAHPASRERTRELAACIDDPCVLWTQAHVHDALAHARGVITVNSGVGFEALLANVPLVCLGRTEYDTAAHAATLATLPQAWTRACAEPADIREQRYARFVDWFMGRHAVDLSRPRQSDPVLQRLLERAIAQVQSAQGASAEEVA